MSILMYYNHVGIRLRLYDVEVMAEAFILLLLQQMRHLREFKLEYIGVCFIFL